MRGIDKTREFIIAHSLSGDAFGYDECSDAFIAEMERGLAGKPSSLRMIPTYLSPDGDLPLGKTAAVVDAGGTNFRTALVTFTEAGPVIERLEQCRMLGSDGSVTWNDFMVFAAQRLAPLLRLTDTVGFCFSYPTMETPERDGRVISLTKEIRIIGSEGRLVCADISGKLAAMGVRGKRMVLLNDVPAVLLSGLGHARSEGCSSMIGLINGTGTNLCCPVPAERIATAEKGDGQMLVNMESGGFEAPGRGDIDAELDAESAAPGSYVHEKTVAGAYLGELCRFALLKAGDEGLFSGATMERFGTLGQVTAPEADAFASSSTGSALEALFVDSEDVQSALRIISAIFERAGKYVCCDLAAAMRFMGGDGPVCVCADGSVFLHSAQFRRALVEHMEKYVKGVLRKRVVLHTTTQATAIGAAAAALLNCD